MALLMILPTVVFALVALLVTLIDALIEIAERRRVPLESPRPIFRPVVIEGGKGTIGPRQVWARDTTAAPSPVQLVQPAVFLGPGSQKIRP